MDKVDSRRVDKVDSRHVDRVDSRRVDRVDSRRVDSRCVDRVDSRRMDKVDSRCVDQAKPVSEDTRSWTQSGWSYSEAERSTSKNKSFAHDKTVDPRVCGTFGKKPVSLGRLVETSREEARSSASHGKHKTGLASDSKAAPAMASNMAFRNSTKVDGNEKAAEMKGKVQTTGSGRTTPKDSKEHRRSKSRDEFGREKSVTGHKQSFMRPRSETETMIKRKSAHNKENAKESRVDHLNKHGVMTVPDAPSGRDAKHSEPRSTTPSSSKFKLGERLSAFGASSGKGFDNRQGSVVQRGEHEFGTKITDSRTESINNKIAAIPTEPSKTSSSRTAAPRKPADDRRPSDQVAQAIARMRQRFKSVEGVAYKRPKISSTLGSPHLATHGNTGGANAVQEQQQLGLGPIRVRPDRGVGAGDATFETEAATPLPTEDSSVSSAAGDATHARAEQPSREQSRISTSLVTETVKVKADYHRESQTKKQPEEAVLVNRKPAGLSESRIENRRQRIALNEVDTTRRPQTEMEVVVASGTENSAGDPYRNNSNAGDGTVQRRPAAEIRPGPWLSAEIPARRSCALASRSLAEPRRGDQGKNTSSVRIEANSVMGAEDTVVRCSAQIETCGFVRQDVSSGSKPPVSGECCSEIVPMRPCTCTSTKMTLEWTLKYRPSVNTHEGGNDATSNCFRWRSGNV